MFCALAFATNLSKIVVNRVEKAGRHACCRFLDVQQCTAVTVYTAIGSRSVNFIAFHRFEGFIKHLDKITSCKCENKHLQSRLVYFNSAGTPVIAMVRKK